MTLQLYIQFWIRLIQIWWSVILYTIVGLVVLAISERRTSMKKLKIEYMSGAKTEISNKRKGITNKFFNQYMDQYARPISNVKKAVLYTYPLKDNEPLTLIENGNIVNEL